MEDIVAVKVIDGAGKPHYFMTWGRVFDAVNPEPLLQALIPHLSKFGISSFGIISLCLSLGEASNELYFYEALFSFSQEKIAFGENYEAWRKERKRRIEDGQEIYYLGTD